MNNDADITITSVFNSSGNGSGFNVLPASTNRRKIIIVAAVAAALAGVLWWRS